MKIAVVGAGISGLLAAYLLHDTHDITVFEANGYAGGHTRTLDVTVRNRTYAVDSGFIVFNPVTYPNLVKLLERLKVAWQPSVMSFSVKNFSTGLEFSPSNLRGLFAQRRNLLRPVFYRMLLDIFRFRRHMARQLVHPHMYARETLAGFLETKAYSKAFINDFILPMGSAIWSADPARFRRFPTRLFFSFFANHGFLNVRGQPQWRVIKGGSSSYVPALTEPFKERLRLNTPVRAVRRHHDHVAVTSSNGDTECFDQVILAVHSDQALSILADPTAAEREILAAIPYQGNLVQLHTDPSVLPTQRAAWASWNYLVPPQPLGRVAVTYNMNILQSISAPVDFCISLNMADFVTPSHVIRSMTYHHPVYTTDGFAAQRRWSEISGVGRTHYCGAYWGYGFHEDGVNSALAVAHCFGKRL